MEELPPFSCYKYCILWVVPIHEFFSASGPVMNTMDAGYKDITEVTDGENWDDEVEDLENPYDVQYGRFQILPLASHSMVTFYLWNKSTK